MLFSPLKSAKISLESIFSLLYRIGKASVPLTLTLVNEKMLARIFVKLKKPQRYETGFCQMPVCIEYVLVLKGIEGIIVVVCDTLIAQKIVLFPC